MQGSPDQDPSYLVYHFEMGSLNGSYSNIAAYNNIGETTHLCGRNTGPQTRASMESGNPRCHCPQNPNREIVYDVIGRGSDQGIDTSAGDESGGIRHSPGFAVYDRCDDQVASSRCKRPTSAEQSERGLYVNLSENQGRLRQGGQHQQQGGKRKQGYDITAGAVPGNQHHRVVLPYCGKTRLMGILQVTIFLMAAVSLALVIMTINGTIVCCADTLGDTAKTEKQTDLSSGFKELQDQISKLKEELNGARKEIKDLKDNSELKIEKLTTQVEQIKNTTQQGTTLNITTQINRHSGKADQFELKLNSTQQTLIAMISEVRLLVNKTDKDLREETRYLRWTGNSTKEKIHQVKDILVTLEDKVRFQEQRLNETIQLKVKHYNEVHSLKLLINNSRQDMMNKLNQMWSSVNTTGKDLQERLRSSQLAVWAALNSTSMDLEQKVSNISKTAGPIGPPGFNGSQGPAGPPGSPGPPGQKGAGDFSACTYKNKTGTTSGASSTAADAWVEAPSGSIIIGATCSTNYAKEHNLASKIILQKRRYICNCIGSSSHILANPQTCILHYWLCPIT